MVICPDVSMTDVRIGYPELCPTPDLDELPEFTISSWVKFDQTEMPQTTIEALYPLLWV